jgi:hydrogenase maturation protease
MTDPETVVLGVGSPLMGDDGLGVAVVERLRATWEGDDTLTLLDGGTWGMRVLPLIESARRLLIVDAIRNGERPGSLIRLDGSQIPRHLHQKLSPHQIELGEVLAVAELRSTIPAELVALGIEPETIELRDRLSETVERSVPGLLRAIDAQLQVWGHARRGTGAAADA